MIFSEEDVWKSIDPDHMWVLDKLILSRKLGYVCGPVGLDVPEPNTYIVRPCVNLLGLGLGTQKLYIEKNTDYLPVGYFWCEFFEGEHLSIDYYKGSPILSVQGFKPDNTFTRWERWKKVDTYFDLPFLLTDFIRYYDYINCEFIDGKLIEVHFRGNNDFSDNITEFIPVWEGEEINTPVGYKYIDYPDVHGRIGAYVK